MTKPRSGRSTRLSLYDIDRVTGRPAAHYHRGIAPLLSRHLGLLAPIFVGSALFFTALMWGLWHYMKSGRGFSREISSELGRAIRNQEFVIHYLPTMDNQSGLCIGAEALIRWNHPRQGLVMPDIFIPIAERTGMIVPMTQWLIEQLPSRWVSG